MAKARLNWPIAKNLAKNKHTRRNLATTSLGHNLRSGYHFFDFSFPSPLILHLLQAYFPEPVALVLLLKPEGVLQRAIEYGYRGLLDACDKFKVRYHDGRDILPGTFHTVVCHTRDTRYCSFLFHQIGGIKKWLTYISSHALMQIFLTNIFIAKQLLLGCRAIWTFTKEKEHIYIHM